MRRGATLALLCVASLCPSPASAVATPSLAGQTALVVFLPAGEAELAGARGLSVGIMSASQGDYSTSQLLLDISQGARVASSAYPSPAPPRLALRASATGVALEGWPAALARARQAPQLLRPGLLAAQVPGGAGYAAVAGGATSDAAAAADGDGRIASVSLGSTSTLLGRIASLTRTRRLVLADLPEGAGGRADLLALSAARPVGELLIAVQRVAERGRGELLWTAASGLPGGGGRELSSQSTQQRGLVVSVDLAPTILAHLGLSIPSAVRGRALEAGSVLHAAALRGLMGRLRVIGGRRLRALGCLLAVWALLLVLAAAWPRTDVVARSRSVAGALRTGALGVLWAPVAALLTAALEPSAAAEYAVLACACLALGALTDRLAPWPRAPLAPAIVAVLVLSLDALAHTQLLMRSLLGPDPILGARFYGIGNELKSALAVLVLAGVAAALYPAVRGRRAAGAMLATGAALAAIEGSALVGAAVGGAILVSGGFALAGVMLMPGALTRRRALLALLAPVLALLALAALDLATAHGSGHFTGSVLHARSPGDLRDVILRRYTAAWRELRNHAMPLATFLALAAGALGVGARKRLLAPVAGDPGWLAALVGGLACGVIGSLVEDSGPVLLVVASFALGCVASYLWGRPPVLSSSRPGRRRGSRSRALRPPAAPVG